MSEEELNESCSDCGINLIRISEDDPMNHRDGDAITCPGCAEVKRVE